MLIWRVRSARSGFCQNSNINNTQLPLLRRECQRSQQCGHDELLRGHELFSASPSRGRRGLLSRVRTATSSTTTGFAATSAPVMALAFRSLTIWDAACSTTPFCSTEHQPDDLTNAAASHLMSIATQAQWSGERGIGPRLSSMPT
jgi:hypothetical protein